LWVDVAVAEILFEALEGVNPLLNRHPLVGLIARAIFVEGVPKETLKLAR
jgi:hypothetical protein